MTENKRAAKRRLFFLFSSLAIPCHCPGATSFQFISQYLVPVPTAQFTPHPLTQDSVGQCCASSSAQLEHAAVYSVVNVIEAFPDAVVIATSSLWVDATAFAVNSPLVAVGVTASAGVFEAEKLVVPSAVISPETSEQSEAAL
jgi:hypothetical protein